MTTITANYTFKDKNNYLLFFICIVSLSYFKHNIKNTFIIEVLINFLSTNFLSSDINAGLNYYYYFITGVGLN